MHLLLEFVFSKVKRKDNYVAKKGDHISKIKCTCTFCINLLRSAKDRPLYTLMMQQINAQDFFFILGYFKKVMWRLHSSPKNLTYINLFLDHFGILKFIPSLYCFSFSGFLWNAFFTFIFWYWSIYFVRSLPKVSKIFTAGAQWLEWGTLEITFQWASSSNPPWHSLGMGSF